MAHLIAEEMSLGDMTILVKLRRGKVSLVEERIEEGATAAGKAVRDLTIPAGCTLAAIVRGREVIAPRGDTVLRPGDDVIAVVRVDQAAALARLLRRGSCIFLLASRVCSSFPRRRESKGELALDPRFLGDDMSG